MEEKERYYSVIDCNEDFVIRDCESNQTCKSLFEVKTLLNYQNREINRLTKMLYTTTKHADKLNEENNKLNKELKKCKQSQKQLAVEELRHIKEYILINDEYDEEAGCNIIETFDLLEDIRDRIEKLGGEENE